MEMTSQDKDRSNISLTLIQLPVDVLGLVFSFLNLTSKLQVYQTCHALRSVLLELGGTFAETGPKIFYPVGRYQDIERLWDNQRYPSFRALAEPHIQLCISAYNFEWIDFQWPIHSLVLHKFHQLTMTPISISVQIVELSVMIIADPQMLRLLHRFPKVKMNQCILRTPIDPLFEYGSLVRRFSYIDSPWNTDGEYIQQVVPALEEIEISANHFEIRREWVAERKRIYLVASTIPEIVKTYTDKVTLQVQRYGDIDLNGFACKELHFQSYWKQNLTVRNNECLKTLHISGGYLLSFTPLRPLKHLLLRQCTVKADFLDHLPELETLEFQSITYKSRVLSICHMPHLRRLVMEWTTDMTCLVEHNPRLSEVFVHVSSPVTSIQHNKSLQYIGIYKSFSLEDPISETKELGSNIKASDVPWKLVTDPLPFSSSFCMNRT